MASPLLVALQLVPVLVVGVVFVSTLRLGRSSESNPNVFDSRRRGKRTTDRPSM